MVKGVVSFCIFFIVLLLSFTSAGQLRVTEEHPFLINGEWIEAKDLQVGDLMQTIDGRQVRITKITDVEVSEEESFPVYNLEAGIYHNFVVCGEENCTNESLGVVVKNSNQVLFSKLNPKTKVKLSLSQEIVEKALTPPSGGSPTLFWQNGKQTALGAQHEMMPILDGISNPDMKRAATDFIVKANRNGWTFIHKSAGVNGLKVAKEGTLGFVSQTNLGNRKVFFVSDYNKFEVPELDLFRKIESFWHEAAHVNQFNFNQWAPISEIAFSQSRLGVIQGVDGVHMLSGLGKSSNLKQTFLYEFYADLNARRLATLSMNWGDTMPISRQIHNSFTTVSRNYPHLSGRLTLDGMEQLTSQAIRHADNVKMFKEMIPSVLTLGGIGGTSIGGLILLSDSYRSSHCIPAQNGLPRVCVSYVESVFEE